MQTPKEEEGPGLHVKAAPSIARSDSASVGKARLRIDDNVVTQVVVAPRRVRSKNALVRCDKVVQILDNVGPD